MAKVTRPTADEIKQVIESRETKDPSMPFVQRSVIKEGPRAYKLAAISHRANDAGQITHRQLHLTCYDYSPRSGSIVDKGPQTRWHCEDAEIEKLRLFLEKCDAAMEHGDHAVVKLSAANAFDEFLKAVGSAPIESSQMIGIIRALAERSSDLRSLSVLGEDDNRRMVAAALRASHRADALRRLGVLIGQNALEAEFQKLLDQNWWMLGGRYVRIIPRKQWTDHETLDILLQSADNYFDLIELKRSNAPLFIKDHGKLIVSAEVNKAINQAAHYLAEIDARRDNFFRRHQIDLFKSKAKVLIGFIADDESEAVAKRQALRMYNSHLNHIEVVTYDELIRIGEHVIEADLGESTVAGQTERSTG